MLVNMNHVLRYAEEKQCCIGAFDTPNLEILMAVIRAASSLASSLAEPVRTRMKMITLQG